MGQISTGNPTVRLYTTTDESKYWCWYCLPHRLKRGAETRINDEIYGYCVYTNIYRIDDCYDIQNDQVWACEKHALELGWIW